MNKIYKVVWSKAKHCYVVTSELAKRQTKGCGARSLRMATVSLGVAASLLCSGAVLPIFGESVAEAAFAPVSGGGSPSPYTITGMVEKGGVTKIFTEKDFYHEGSPQNYGYANSVFLGDVDPLPTTESGYTTVVTAATDWRMFVNVGLPEGTVSNNTITVKGDSTKIYQSVTGGYVFGKGENSTGTVIKNTVNIEGGQIGDVYGGDMGGYYAVTGDATENVVNISAGTVKNVSGGNTFVKAERNEVNITGGTVTGTITGGAVTGIIPGSASDSGKADSNKVTITAGTIGNSSTNSTSVEIIGGKGVTSASSNTVSINGNVKVVGYTNVYGGKASGNAQEKKQGEAKSNNVTINYSASNPNNKLDSIYGGYAGDDSNAPGVVTGNTVTINGGDIYWAYGGAAKYGNVEWNTANFSGGTNRNSVYGGVTQYGNANNNTVTVDGGTIEGAFGGTVGNQSEDSYGDATYNTVTINDGTVKQQTIGGNSRNGVAKNNTLTIAGGLIATNGFLVAGGQTTTGSAENNSVFINKGTIQGSVYGGRSAEKGSVTGNQVFIKGGEITGRTLSTGYRVSNVYGGYSSGGDVTGNNVSIQGNATIDSRSSIYGGWSKDYVWVNKDGVLTREEQGGGAASYNSVNIFKAITVNGLYGGVGDATKSTGNTLFLATTGVKAEEVGSFQRIALTNALSWSDGATVLTATKFDDGTAVKASLDVSAANFTSAANGEKMTLLASGTDNNIKALSLKYNGGTADLSESKLNQVVKEGTITPDSGTNGVTINTSKNAHIVSLDAANSFKNVTYRVADYVQGVSFGEMTWGTGRDASGTDFADVTDANIDISGLSFKDPGKIAANGTMKLVENATNLAAGTDREHSQTFNENATNGVTIAGTLNGTVTRTTAGEIGYKAAGNTLSVNLAGWDKTKDEDSTTLSGWAKPISTTVETDGMNVSGMNPGDKKTILTADTADFFKDAVVNGTNKWKESGDFSETTKGVTVTGTTTGGGVKVDETTNKSIIYQQSKNDVTTLKLEGITFDSTDVAATFGNAYDFTPATITASDTSDVLFTNASSLTSNQSMTLVDTTGALGTATIAAFTDKSYVKPINEDVTGNLHLNGGRTDWLKQDGGTKLVYTVGDNLVTDATLSGDLAWDVSAPHYNNTDYKFDGNTTVNVGVNFTATVDPLNATTKSMTLIKNAADDSKVTGTPAFTVSLDQANTTLSANATGAAGLSGNDVTYTVSGVELNKVTVKSVGDTYDTVPDGWTMASNLTIDTDSMTEPIFAAGSPKAILKGNGYFNSVTITGANAFGTKDFEPVSGNGVTLSGTQDKGVDKSPDNAYIVYKMGKKNVQTVDIGTVEWGGEALDGSSADYNYAGAAFGTDNFVISNPDQVEVDTSMTLLKANETLAAMAEETKKASFVYSPVSGVRIDGDITGTMSRSGNNIMFAATENKASQLTFTNVEWKDTLMTRPANIVFDGAKVVTTDIKFTNIDSQVADQTMTLVKNFDGTPSAIEGDHYMVGSGRMGEGAAEMSGNDLIFRAKTGTAPTEATHETVMAMEAGTAVVAAGREYVDSAVEGLGLVSNMAPDGTSTFASMGGGVGRYKTGSHVDTHTWSAVVAVGSKREHKKGNLEWGVFAEYGRGNYTLHDDNGGRGDGDTNYAGGGLLAKWTNKHDVYTEASVRMGRMSDSASNMLMDRLGNSYGYDIHANYFGAHVGLGKIIKVKKNRDLDVYGKYFYLRRNGVDFDAGGNHYTLDSVTSSLLRIGARYGSNDKKWNWYGGLAYEYEFGGESKGTVDGLAIRSASIKGGSVRGEIGMRMEATKTNPWKVDIGIYGYGGKHRGFGGNVSVAYMF